MKTFICILLSVAMSLSPVKVRSGNIKIPETDNRNEKAKVFAAIVQFKLDSNVSLNTGKIIEYIEQAAGQNADLVVFPETAITGYIPFYKVDRVEDICTQAEIEDALNAIMRTARKNNIAVSVGTAWQDEDNIWWNRAYFIDEDGKILEHYDKVQLTGDDRSYFRAGNRLGSFTWRGMRLGMLICYDMRYPELWRLMRMEDVQLVLHLVSAIGNAEWKVPVLEGTLRGHAASNGYYVLSANNAGPVQMVISAIYNPKGLILARGNYGVEEIIYSDLEIGPPDGEVNFRNDIYELIKVK